MGATSHSVSASQEANCPRLAVVGVGAPRPSRRSSSGQWLDPTGTLGAVVATAEPEWQGKRRRQRDRSPPWAETRLSSRSLSYGLVVAADEVFEKKLAFPGGLNLLVDLPRVGLIIDAVGRHATEHQWGARWTHEARHSSGSITAASWNELLERVRLRDLLSLHSLLVPEGQHYSTTPVFILRLEAPSQGAGSRAWVRTRSETETLGLASRVEELLFAGRSSVASRAEGPASQLSISTEVTKAQQQEPEPAASGRAPVRPAWENPWLIAIGATVAGGLILAGLLGALGN